MILLQMKEKCLGWERFSSTSMNNHDMFFYFFEVERRGGKDWSGAPIFHFNPLTSA